MLSHQNILNFQMLTSNVNIDKKKKLLKNIIN